MIWLTWRQHRVQALFAVIGLAVLAAVLVPTGRQMYHALADTGLAGCLDKLGHAEFVDPRMLRSCEETAGKFDNAYGSRLNLAVLLAVLPLLVGLFWGAPLVAREVEHGTHRLVWTQGVTRLRWALVKFGLVGAGAVLVAVVYALLVTWWMTPFARAGTGRFDYPFFDLHGLVPVAYTLFAVALGVFAGTVTRKALPAMAVTLVGFLAARIVVAAWARPRFQAPLERTFPVQTDVVANRYTGDWVLSEGVYDGAGNLIERDATAVCVVSPNTEAPAEAGCHGPGAYNGATYQPGDRFWLFQHIEAGAYVALAALLLYLAIHRVRRRIS